ncbi:hypothetical protein HCZ30_07390 [Marivivens donghaensis]|uniref:YMGG-like Gly-zipper domain-containing protein n=1 Tax=Marivivens donghaensis TaxID=1699413 RepID=A0ABX0VYJ8_9RHOB|nr:MULTISPECIES: hypothetical protein [Marivivens]NIY72257.1 hypothetical protein [Marivivens donghaensis]
MFKATWIVAAVATLGLSACLDTDLERGLAGATAGAVVAGQTNVDPAVGAVAGGAIGVTCSNYSSVCN